MRPSSETVAEGPPATVPQFVPPLGPNELSKSDDFKKRRGPVSCAECRRLKLKCDRRLPCSSCTKRGCAAICPNGTLAAGPGNRFVLADTQHLHEKISQMGKRITELEDALAELQAQVSNEKHPLLSDELMLLKAPMSTANVAATMNDVSGLLSDSLGTLTLGDRSKFVGPTASADYLITDDTAQDTAGSSCALPLEILLMANTFPLTSVREMRHHIMNRLSDFLPPAPDAWTLAELYYKNATWLFNLVPKEEFVETIFSVVYAGPTPSAAAIAPHDLGIMFMMFAIACMTDLNRPPYNTEASNYYQLARVAIGIDSVIDHPTLQAVRGIHMMSTFLQMCDHPNGATACYSLLGLNSQLCQALGLHRVDTQWNLSDAERAKRRLVFWDVVSFDSWVSFALGRPPSFSMAHIDAKLPMDPDTMTGEDGQNQLTFRGWFHLFTQDCLLKVMEQAFGVAPLTYATVLRLDRMVRDHSLSENLRLATDCTKPGIQVPLALQRTAIFSLTQILLLYLHRSFFAQSSNECAEDPLKGKYSQSVLAVFRCALYITSSIRSLCSQTQLCVRYWIFWSHCFSASIILGTIVIRSPGCGLAPAAWVELDRVYELFEQLGPKSRRIARILPKMRKLHQAAKESYQTFTIEHRMEGCQIADSDLKFFYGFTRVLDKGSPRSGASGPATPGSGGSPGSSATLASVPPTQALPSQPNFNEFLATLYPTGYPPQQSQLQLPQLQQLQQPQQQQQLTSDSSPMALPGQDPAQWSLEQWMASTAPIPMDTSFPPFEMDSAAAAPAVVPQATDASTQSWTLPPAWVDRAMDPLDTPSPETGEHLLPGPYLDDTWQKFMHGIGLFDEVPLLPPS